MDGIACRVPVPDGSAVDLFVEIEKETNLTEFNQIVKNASQSDRLKNIFEYSEDPIVSTDIIGNSNSSIYDCSGTSVINGRFLRTLNWYDNEWGYSNRVVNLIDLLSKFV